MTTNHPFLTGVAAKRQPNHHGIGFLSSIDFLRPNNRLFFYNVLRYDNGNFIHNNFAYLKAQDNFQQGYCMKIIKIV
jgi:hypothetical protein